MRTIFFCHQHLVFFFSALLVLSTFLHAYQQPVTFPKVVTTKLLSGSAEKKNKTEKENEDGETKRQKEKKKRKKQVTNDLQMATNSPPTSRPPSLGIVQHIPRQHYPS